MESQLQDPKLFVKSRRASACRRVSRTRSNTRADIIPVLDAEAQFYSYAAHGTGLDIGLLVGSSTYASTLCMPRQYNACTASMHVLPLPHHCRACISSKLDLTGLLQCHRMTLTSCAREAVRGAIEAIPRLAPAPP